MLAGPVVGLLLVAVHQVGQARTDARRTNDQAELAVSMAGVDSLLGRLQQERNLTGSYLRNTAPPPEFEVATMEEARPLTDQALEEFGVRLDAASEPVREAYRPALDAVAGRDGSRPGLEELRRQVDEYTGQRGLVLDEAFSSQVFGSYDQLIELLFAGNAAISREFDDPDLRRGGELIARVSSQSNTIAQLVRALLVTGVGTEGGRLDGKDEIRHVAELRSNLRANDAAIRAAAAGPYRPLVVRLYGSEHVARFPQTIDAALETGTVDLAAVARDVGPSDTRDLAYRTFSVGVAERLRGQAHDLAAEAEQRRNEYMAVASVLALIGVAGAWLASRSITRPLRSLTRQATSMAHERLPRAVQDILDTPLGHDVTIPRMEPITVRARDEVADVAEALNTVQESALELAVEQAVLRRNIADSFVNLGRRNQSLLSRQLDFITELERNETDPDALASLFRLDHLATRMRRNAESLLVLAGLDPPRQWAAPVRVIDVVRAALGEVESYNRVVVRSVEAATILGSAAADLTHLLAELVENALAFSPPERTVDVFGRCHEQGYEIAVVDFGPGMAVRDVQSANRRLAGAESFTIAPSKYLGHYVTGQLAARHGITVELRNALGAGPGHGLVATVALPPGVLTAEAAASADPPDAPPCGPREPRVMA